MLTENRFDSLITKGSLHISSAETDVARRYAWSCKRYALRTHHMGLLSLGQIPRGTEG